MLLEGELDVLSIVQECGDLVSVVATGTTKDSHTPRWISLGQLPSTAPYL